MLPKSPVTRKASLPPQPEVTVSKKDNYHTLSPLRFHLCDKKITTGLEELPP